MKSQRKLLIYSLDSTLRKAYATYLHRNGIPTDSCGTIEELKRLSSWYVYEFILINVDTLTVDSERTALEQCLKSLIEQADAETLLIATSKLPKEQVEFNYFNWFLQEPITPKRILTAISQIRQQFPKRHISLRKSLSKPLEFE